MSTLPQRLGKYELLERLGHGGVAEVWKARDTRLQRFVAIKVLQPNLREDPDFTKRFEREAQFIASLHHPNIVQIHDFQIVPPGEETAAIPASVAYMVMDYVEGHTLADYIHESSNRGNIPSWTEIVNLFTSISLAIDYAHQKGMIHRDIKPANILLDAHNTARNPMGEPIFTDFGVAKLMSTSTNTLTGAQMGTPLYISPEQAKGYPGNERSDLYSLGVILYEIVTGVPPFRGDTPVEVLTQHVNTPPINPALINPALPANLNVVIMRSLAKEPDARFSSASAMAIAIAEALQLPVPEALGGPSYPPDTEDMPTHIGPMPVFPATATSQAAPGIAVRTTGGQGNMPTPTPTPNNSSNSFTPMMLYPTPTNAYPASSPTRPVEAPPQAPHPPYAVSPQPPAGSPDRRRRALLAVLIAALIVILIASSLGALFLLRHSSPTTPVAISPIVGQAFYVSSGQVTAGTSDGIADQMKIHLQHILAPHAGKSYYAWLLPDRHPEQNPDDTGPRPIRPPILLTNHLPVQNNTVDYFYAGNAQHANLLSTTSRLLITEEASGLTPSAPSTDHTTWRYYAEIPQEQIPGDGVGFTALVHIRHLFYNETNIQVLGLPGGLDFWMYKNTEKVLEWAISARDYWQGPATSQDNLNLTHYQIERILEYLDGTRHYQVDIPANTPLQVDPAIAKVALLTVGGQGTAAVSTYRTDPPGYVDHVQLHVGQVAKAPHISKAFLQHTTTILDDVNQAKLWLTKVRQDAIQLYQMSNNLTQFKQADAGATLDDMATMAQYAYLGQLNPTTNTVQGGVLQVHYEIQQLAVLAVSSNVPTTL